MYIKTRIIKEIRVKSRAAFGGVCVQCDRNGCEADFGKSNNDNVKHNDSSLNIVINREFNATEARGAH